MNRKSVIARLPNPIGDLLMTLPALDLLHSKGMLGTVLCQRYASALLAGLPYQQENVKDGKQEVEQYRNSDCAYGLLMRSSATTAFRMRRGGLKPIGYKRHVRSLVLWRGTPYRRNWPRVYEYYRVAQFTAAMLEGREMPKHIDMPPFLHLPLTQAHNQAAANALAVAGVQAPYTVVCPVVANRRTPIHRIYPQFPQLMEQLLKEGQTIICCPGPGEEEECRSRAPGSVQLNVDLMTLTGILGGARRLISVDTGPLHIAAALGVPGIGIYGDTPPARWSAWGPRSAHVGGLGHWPSVDEIMRKLDGLDDYWRPAPQPGRLSQVTEAD